MIRLLTRSRNSGAPGLGVTTYNAVNNLEFLLYLAAYIVVPSTRI
jgi:hypothetical protein